MRSCPDTDIDPKKAYHNKILHAICELYILLVYRYLQPKFVQYKSQMPDNYDLTSVY